MFERNELDLMRTLFEDVPILMCVLEGPEHRLRYMNQNLQQLFGGRDIDAGTPVKQLWPEFSNSNADSDNLFEILENIYQTGKYYTFNELEAKIDRNNTGEPEEAYFNITGHPMKDKDGNVYGIFLAGYEVTDHVLARQEKEKSEKRLSLTLEGAKVGLWEVDIVNKKVDFMSDQCKAHYGVPPGEEFEYDDFYRAVLPEDQELVNKKIQEAVEEDRLYEAEYRVRWPDESLHWLLARGHCLRDSTGQPYYLLGITMDITPQKETERRLKEAIRIRDDFLSIASHELQTPVTSMKARAELFERRLRDANEDEWARQAARLNERIDQLSKLTSKLLDISRLQEGGLQLEMETFPLIELVEDAVETIGHVSEHHIELKSESRKPVYADRNRIGQVITNLLNNAIKYSPSGERVLVDVTDTDGWVKVSVTDFGVGIPEEDKGRIFERFFKGSNPDRQTYPGFGIGLYICAQIIRRHDGEIHVEDNPKGGTIFTFSLPAFTGN